VVNLSISIFSSISQLVFLLVTIGILMVTSNSGHRYIEWTADGSSG